MGRLGSGGITGLVGRSLLALMLAGGSHVLAGPRQGSAAPAPAGRTLALPTLIAGVPVAPSAAEPVGPILWRVQPALSHHLAGFAVTGTAAAAPAAEGAKNPAAEALDPVTTSAIVRSVFGSYAIPIRNFPVAGRWAKVFRMVKACAAGAKCGSDPAAFAALTGQLEGSSFLEKVRAVNLRVNRAVKYRDDTAVYGRFDHWAPPGEVLSKRRGDCEDFVILKMAALMKAGVPARSMSLVVLQIRGKDVFHAVLAVNTSGGALILDNVSDAVVSDTSIRDYTPLYSLSIDRAWLHGTAAGGKEVARNDMQFRSVAPGEGSREPAGPAVERVVPD